LNQANLSTLAPLAQINNYFDNIKNTKDRETRNDDYSHHRLSDVAYHRNYNYNDKKTIETPDKRNDLGIVPRPNTAKIPRCSSMTPARCKLYIFDSFSK
jgi:hypothetical protein